MKILVIQHKMIGDVLVSSLICENLRIQYPDAQIDYLVNDNTIPVLENNPYISNIIVFNAKEHKGFLKLIQFGLKIRKQNYDLVIDAYSKLQSWVISFLSGAQTKISYKKPFRNWIYDYNIPYAENPETYLGLAIERRLSLLAPLKLSSPLLEFPKLFLSENEINWAKDLFEKNDVSSNKKTIMISIIGSEKKKTYPFNYMVEIINFIGNNYEVNILFNYFPKQMNDALKIYNSLDNTCKNKVYFSIFGDSLREYIAIMNNCSMIIGNDGGAINMAKSLDKASFIIFSPWIEKKIWATFEDGKKHTSVHLNDFKPELFENTTEKELKKNALSLYNEFKPNFIYLKLKEFLDYNL